MSTPFSEGIGASLENIMPYTSEISEKKRVHTRCAWTVLWCPEAKRGVVSRVPDLSLDVGPLCGL